MPPDPILALISVVALFVYSCAGALAGVGMDKLFKPSRFDQPFVFWITVAAWPALVAGVTVFYLPVLTAHKIARYIRPSLETGMD